MNSSVSKAFFSLLLLVLMNTTMSFAQRTKADVAQQIVGYWVVESWQEKYDGDLMKGRLLISGELVGTLRGESPGGREVVEQFTIQILDDGTVKMDGRILVGKTYFIPDHFKLTLSKDGSKLYGQSIDDHGDVIDAVFIRLQEEVM